MDKLDFKKADKALYMPGTSPSAVTVPEMTFIMVDGRGDPNAPDGEYSKAVELLYALTYAIKMSKLGGRAPAGYFEYVVPPLEGLWWYDDGGAFRFGAKEHFCWTAMIRQPGFVTPEVFERAVLETAGKKPALNTGGARLSRYEEGLCVQCMHVGPYDAEPATVARMDAFMRAGGLAPDFSETRRHHEIYLGDPRKTDPAKLKTVIRHPVKPAE
ncbi:hypothetical protein SAMN02745823_02941 [Sporobacter termitidis DSM 10068]|uniref:GyrI-like small molecule binding domain-containing protein n=1 Tax=Sporobacter termitidis DSM 10068 TaxID=1123282 RepID=A0A1M5YX34_9FIRM|nr:GyrI-like domain-containing protein [Sporobacter termitidis]SHI16525.1 hypothetical protein SAMN02745823_02941 [Sporobacter termitidis DSM 10068]